LAWEISESDLSIAAWARLRLRLDLRRIRSEHDGLGGGQKESSDGSAGGRFGPIIECRRYQDDQEQDADIPVPERWPVEKSPLRDVQHAQAEAGLTERHKPGLLEAIGGATATGQAADDEL
jgi:hypothetical protein